MWLVGVVGGCGQWLCPVSGCGWWVWLVGATDGCVQQYMNNK